jgi:ribonuclease D
MALDTETTGRDIRDGNGYAVGISAAVQHNHSYYTAYFPVAHYSDNVTDELKEILFNLIASRTRVVFHNAKFDLESMETAGYRMGYKRWYCTMLMAHMLNENIPKGLDWLARNELKVSGKVEKDFSSIWSMGLGHMIPVAEIEEYACVDTVLALMLFYKLYPYFVKSGFDGSEMQEV